MDAMDAILPKNFICAAAPDPPIPMTDLDPDRDAVLVIGQLRLLIKVSSKVMELASPKLKEMVDPRFLDWPLSVDDPPEILLPHDDPWAMLWLCTFIHHQEWPNGPLSTDMVKKIAILCEKYQLAVALRYWSWISLRILINDTCGCRDLGISQWEVMWMARALDDQEAFILSTRHHIWQARRDLRPRPIDENMDPSSVDAMGLSMLPARLWGRIDSTTIRDRVTDSFLDTLDDLKVGLGRSLNTKIDQIIEPHLLPTPCAGQSMLFGQPTVCARSDRVLYFFGELRRLGAWPMRHKLSTERLGWVAQQLRGYRNSMWLGDCTCLAFVNFRDEVNGIIDQVKDQPAHLCLNCITNGFVSVEEGNCRATAKDQCRMT